MIADPEIAASIAKNIQESYRLLDDAAYLVRQRCTEAETADYIQATGIVCAEIIFKLMEPLYQRHPKLAPEGWDLASAREAEKGQA